eukprot:TRINITY_DN4864_c0_g1_i1.p1 TRINITY_DN4864_c0_g1~~TRINITY_DN4864_c0_g1_i1.p1  ORF type:complete len:411 (+),score=49.02 TRINITY_DN4864_c0_g1_i1:72-1235(+)
MPYDQSTKTNDLAYRKVKQFYEDRYPEKVGEVDDLFLKYQGRENEVLGNFKYWYPEWVWDKDINSDRRAPRRPPRPRGEDPLGVTWDGNTITGVIPENNIAIRKGLCRGMKLIKVGPDRVFDTESREKYLLGKTVSLTFSKRNFSATDQTLHKVLLINPPSSVEEFFRTTYPEADIVPLKGIWDNILPGLKWLVRNTGPGASLFAYFGFTPEMESNRNDIDIVNALNSVKLGVRLLVVTNDPTRLDYLPCKLSKSSEGPGLQWENSPYKHDAASKVQTEGLSSVVSGGAPEDDDMLIRYLCQDVFNRDLGWSYHRLALRLTQMVDNLTLSFTRTVDLSQTFSLFVPLDERDKGQLAVVSSNLATLKLTSAIQKSRRASMGPCYKPFY